MNSINPPPSGLVTFMFTDIEGSTRIAQQFPQSMPLLLERHHTILKNTIASNNGYIVDFTGDGFLSAFQKAEDAIRAAAIIQLSLAGEDWNETEIRIRIGIHSGQVQLNESRYIGYLTLARTARIMSATYGGQILISEDTYRLSSDHVIKFELKGSDESKLISFKDLGERRLKDLIQPIRLYQILAEGLREEFPLPKTLDTRPNNLPIQLTSFIGRKEEILSVKSMIKNTHLLTLTGSGGSGKTRLALQVAADSIDDFEQGAWFIELASIVEPQLLVQSMIQMFGIKENPDLNSESAVAEYIGNKEMLLLIDNCEHLINDVAALIQSLLSKCPKLKIIATSREALRCYGEHTHRVLSLKFPGPNLKESPEKLTQYESVRLFIERALAVNSGFRVNNENAPALAEICSQLDGIPLAIELAAARTKIMSVEQIYKRLDKRFSLLTGGTRTAKPRQQTLKALIDWSYDLLSENERTLWNRLSIFSGGWTLEAAEKICSDELINEIEVADLLTELTEKSIIIFDENNERFRMLETIKQYGDEKLRQSNEFETISSNHLGYFIRNAEAMEMKLKVRHSDMPEWMKAMDSESANIERCLLCCAESGKNEELLRLSLSMSYYWEIKGNINGATRWLDTAILKNNSEESEVHQKAVLEFANLLRLKGEYQRAKALFEENLSKARNRNDVKDEALTLNRLGMTSYSLGDFEGAAGYYTRSIKILEDAGDKPALSRVLNNLGNVRSNQGKYSEASELYERALELRKMEGDIFGMAITLNNIGIIAYERGDYKKAEDMLKESLKIRDEVGDKAGKGICYDNLGNIAYNQGDYESSGEYYIKSFDIACESGDKAGRAESLLNIGKNVLEQNDFTSAENFLNESLDIALALRSESLQASLLCMLGRVYFYKGDPENSIKMYEESIALFSKTGNMKDISLTFIRIMELHAKSGDASFAATLLGFINTEFIENKQIVFPKTEQMSMIESASRLKEILNKADYEEKVNLGTKLNMEAAIELVSSRRV